MKNVVFMAVALFALAGPARGGEPPDDAVAFARNVIGTLLSAEPAGTFAVAESVFTLDNGEVVSRQEFAKVWPELGRRALKKPVDTDRFFRDVAIEFASPRENKRLMSNEKVLAAYKPLDGDILCDASRVKPGVENFIDYEKAFLFVLRKTEGKWTLIGIGG